MRKCLPRKGCILLVFFVGLYSSYSFADVFGIPFVVGDDAFCKTGVFMTSLKGVCTWDGVGHEKDGIGLFPAGKISTSSDGQTRWGFKGVYPPFTGDYYLRIRYCHSTSAGNCSIHQTSEYFDTGTRHLVSSKSVGDQVPIFPAGGGGMLSSPSTACYTLVSNEGTEWSTAGIGASCQDATFLPTYPSFCYLNMGSDLDVDMGTVERGMIATVPGSTTKKEIQIKVLCTSDAVLTATYSFSYTPITIMGSEVVSTSTDGLGVAVYLDDKMMSTTDSVSKDYGPGLSRLNLGFELVRDPNANIGTIATGEYHADVILVLTKQ